VRLQLKYFWAPKAWFRIICRMFRVEVVLSPVSMCAEKGRRWFWRGRGTGVSAGFV